MKILDRSKYSDEFQVPRHTLEALERYIEDRVPTGGFLYAVLTNDLNTACSRADSENRVALWDINAWLYNYAPTECWGTPEKVDEWLDDIKTKGATPPSE